MSVSLLVEVSGSVGKQVFKTSGNNTYKATLKRVIVSTSAANAMIKIRDGNASGEVVLWGRALSAYGGRDFPIKHKFTKGMHVLLTGTNAQAYLIYE